MEIQKKAAEPEKVQFSRKAFVRYGSIAAAILLVCGTLLGSALTKGAQKSAGAPAESAMAAADTTSAGHMVAESAVLGAAEAAPESAASSEGAPAAGVTADAAAAEAQTPEQADSYDALYDIMFAMEQYYGADKMSVAAAGDAGMGSSTAVAAEPRAEAAAADGAKTASFSLGGNGGADHSETNVQVAGVDEADIVKTDGEYIYRITNDELIILKAAGRDTSIVSKTAYLNNSENWWGYASEMFLLGDRLMIITGAQDLVWAGSAQNRYQNYEQRTLSLIYDVSDRANPKLITTLGQSGSYVSARLVSSYVYLVTSRWVYDMQRGEPRTFVPTLSRDGVNEAMPVESIYLYDGANTPVYTVVSSFDLSGGTQQASSRAALGRTGDVYCSGKNLLLAAGDYRENVTPIAPGSDGRNVQVTTSSPYTRLMLFALDGASIEKKAASSVPGTLVNQFAMDEYNGAFRIVTTVNEWTQYVYTDGVDTYDYQDKTYNCLYTLDENLAVLGTLDQLAENEWVQSVRFDGDIAYFVTFRQVDPLFTVDVSDPKNPKILSTLKIPGFSEYLHVFADGRLVGIGYSANEETGATNGVKLSMFDTSNKADVQEIAKFFVDADWTLAGSNHKSILINAEKNIIAFPADESYRVFSYTDAAGFTEKATVRLDNTYWSGNLRGLFIGDCLYVLSDAGVAVLSLADFSTVCQFAYAG